MEWGSTVAFAAALLVVSLPVLLLVSLPMLQNSRDAKSPLHNCSCQSDADKYEQESRRMFAEWKARFKKSYKYAGEEECRLAVFKETRCRVAWSRAAGGSTAIGLNGLSARSIEEMARGYRVRKEEISYEQETRRMFVGWKAKYGKTYRDVGEEECRYRLFKANRRLVIHLNAAASLGRQNVVYDTNQIR